VARYQILAWRDIPTQIRVTDETGAKVNRVLPRWFMQEISRITMREGLAATDDYLDAFEWTAEAEREGTAEEVAETLNAEINARFGRTEDGRRIATTDVIATTE
jgi:Virulence factor